VKYSISGNVTLKICCYFFLCQHDFCSLHNWDGCTRRIRMKHWFLFCHNYICCIIIKLGNLEKWALKSKRDISVVCWWTLIKLIAMLVNLTKYPQNISLNKLN
jgi:hypothetical protein